MAPLTPSGLVDYRLRQVDFDGSVQFTAPISIPVPEPSATLGLIAGIGTLFGLSRWRGVPRQDP